MDQQIQQIIMMYAQLVGVSPEDILSQLQQLPQEQQQQALEQMVSEIQSSSQTQQQEVSPYNSNEYMEEQQEMRRGGYRQYMQEAGTVEQPQRIVQMVRMKDGSMGEYNPQLPPDLTPEDWAIYGEGNNTRMVPVKTTNTDPKYNPYMRGDYNAREYTSEGQADFQKEREIRAASEPLRQSAVSKDELMRMQQVLVDAGYDLGKYGPDRNGVDGAMGRKTAEAMRRFEAEHPEAFKAYINMDTADLPKAVGRPTTSGQVKIEKPIVNKEAYNKSKYTNDSEKNESKSIQVKSKPTEAAVKAPVKAAATTQVVENTKKSSTSNAVHGFDKDTNRIIYSGKTYTPYQFKQYVEDLENKPYSQVTGGAPNDVLRMLNDALYFNKKSMFRSKVNDRTGYGEKNKAGYYHSYK